MRPRLHGAAGAVMLALALPAAAADGRALAAELCARCHGLDGIAPPSAAAATPHLAGLDSAYLARQLAAFADGRRHDEDMRAAVADLDDDGRQALARWYAGRRPAPFSPTAAGDAGRRLYDEGNGDPAVQPCASCHQPDAVGNARFPRLAGQRADYLRKQLGDFKAGRRATDPAMTAVARGLAPGDISALAAYLSGL